MPCTGEPGQVEVKLAAVPRLPTVAVPIVLAVNTQAPETGGDRDIPQLSDAAPAHAKAHQGSPSTSDLAMEVPGWRRFVTTERRLNGDTGGERGSATQSIPQAASRGTPHKEQAARQSLHSRQQHFSAQPPESGSQPANEQAGIEDATGDARNLAAKHREAVLREFLRRREQLLLSQKYAQPAVTAPPPPQAAGDAFK